MKLAPSLYQAYQRRHWLLASSIIENVLFSAILLGWPALIAILKSEGYYSHLCPDSPEPKNYEGSESTLMALSSNLTNVRADQFAMLMSNSDRIADHASMIQPPLVDISPHPIDRNTIGCCSDETPICVAQERKLNLCFTVGAFMLSALTLPIGVALEKFGARLLRILGAALVGISAILFASSNPDSPNILFFASTVNGVGGNIIVYTSMQISNLFGPSRPTVLGLLIGSYAAAAIVFPIMKVLYTLGVSLQLLFMGMAVAMLAVILNCCLNIPEESIPMSMDLARLVDSGSIPSRFYSTIQRLSGTADKDKEPASDLQSPGSESGIRTAESNEEAVVMSLYRVIFMPMYLWSIVVISITQLRLLFFVGDLHQSLIQMAHNNPETVDLYIFIFGILQICCLGTTHFLGGFVDWKSKKAVGVDEDSSQSYANQSPRKSKPIPSSSTTTSLVGDRLRSPEPLLTTPSPMLTQADNCGYFRQPSPVLPSSLPSTPEVHGYKLGNTTGAGIASPAHSCQSDTSRGGARKSSTVQIPVGTPPDGASRKVSLIASATPSTPEKANKTPTKQQSSSGITLAGSRDLDRKICKFRDCANVFFITSTVMVIFGLLVLIPNLTLQVSTFVCYTLIRGFVPCAIGRLYSVAFHPIHHQALIGLAFLTSAFFSVLQHPLFVLVLNNFHGDPYWVNVGLLILSLFSFGLPLHTLLHCRHLEEWRKTSSSPMQPVIIKMQYMDSKVVGRGTPTDL